VDQFGHLLISTKVWMLGLALAAIFMGFFEFVMRERAGFLGRLSAQACTRKIGRLQKTISKRATLLRRGPDS
jgi:hypothetical protein